MNKIAFITGATAGIGEACAKKLAKIGFDLIISGRRKEKLENLKQELIANYQRKVFTIELDVRNQKEVESKINSLPEEWTKIDLLLNNAGLAVGVTPVQEGVIDDWERMIDTNLKGLLYVTRAITPLMIERKKGQIINITSIAGKEVYPGGNVYCATKHAVDAITKGMRIDLLPHNIKVCSLAPGMVDTEFSLVRFKGDSEKAEQVYNGFTPLYAEDIAETVEFIATRPAHVNINDILIMATDQASARDINKQ
jgi:3-hydroxy acid dehydrogenase/malonic semialdehyde reductase